MLWHYITDICSSCNPGQLLLQLLVSAAMHYVFVRMQFQNLSIKVVGFAYESFSASKKKRIFSLENYTLNLINQFLFYHTETYILIENKHC